MEKITSRPPRFLASLHTMDLVGLAILSSIMIVAALFGDTKGTSTSKKVHNASSIVNSK